MPGPMPGGAEIGLSGPPKPSSQTEQGWGTKEPIGTTGARTPNIEVQTGKAPVKTESTDQPAEIKILGAIVSSAQAENALREARERGASMEELAVLNQNILEAKKNREAILSTPEGQKFITGLKQEQENLQRQAALETDPEKKKSLARRLLEITALILFGGVSEVMGEVKGAVDDQTNQRR